MKLTLASTVNPASVTWEHRAASRILRTHKHTQLKKATQRLWFSVVCNQGLSKSSTSNWVCRGTQWAALWCHRLFTRTGIMYQTIDPFQIVNLVCSIKNCIPKVQTVCGTFYIFTSVWQDNTSKQIFVHFQREATLPEREILWILKQAVDILVRDGGTGAYMFVFFSLESGTVESHCSEGGISDVTAARHTKDLQLVASSAQTDQAFICYLLEATDAHEKQQKHRGIHTHPSGIIISLSLPTYRNQVFVLLCKTAC